MSVLYLSHYCHIAGTLLLQNKKPHPYGNMDEAVAGGFAELPGRL